MLSEIKVLYSDAQIVEYYMNDDPDPNPSRHSQPSVQSLLERKLGIDKTKKYKQEDCRYYFIVVSEDKSKKKQRGGPSDGKWSLKV